MRLLAIMAKDLRQIGRDVKSALFLVVLPVLFTVVFGIAMPGSNADPRLPVGWLEQGTGGPYTQSLRHALEQSDTIRLVVLAAQDLAAADKEVHDGKLTAAVIVPAGFSANSAVQPTVVVLPSSTSGQTALKVVESSWKRVLGAREIVRLAAQAAAAQPAAGDDSIIDEQAAFSQAMAGWEQPALSVSVEQARGDAGPAKSLPAGFAQSSPGMLVQFAVFGLITSAMVLVLERKTRTLSRMLSMPLRASEIIAGHALAMFAVGVLQSAVLITLGQFLFGVNYLREPLGILIMVVALSLWSASLGLLISALARKEDQVVMIALILMFVLAAFGGAWFPLEVAGPAFAAIGHLMPTAWAMDGFQNIVVRGLGWSSTLLPAGVLLAYAAALLGLAVWRFKYE